MDAGCTRRFTTRAETWRTGSRNSRWLVCGPDVFEPDAGQSTAAVFPGVRLHDGRDVAPGGAGTGAELDPAAFGLDSIENGFIVRKLPDASFVEPRSLLGHNSISSTSLDPMIDSLYLLSTAKLLRRHFLEEHANTSPYLSR